MGVLDCSASQEERINMLIIVLDEKGVFTSGGHYEPTQTPTSTTGAAASAPRQPPAPLPDAAIDESNGADDGGVIL